MRKFFLLTAALGISTLGAMTAQAGDNEGLYVNIGASLLNADLDASGDPAVDALLGDSLNFTAVTGRAGYRLTDFLAIEGEVGIGLSGEDFNDTVSVQGIDVSVDGEVKVDAYYAAFARGILPVSEDFDIFARIGYGQAEIGVDLTASAQGQSSTTSETDSGDDFLFGVGAEYGFTKNDGVRLDYTRFSDINVISLAYSRRF